MEVCNFTKEVHWNGKFVGSYVSFFLLFKPLWNKIDWLNQNTKMYHGVYFIYRKHKYIHAFIYIKHKYIHAHI